MILTLSAVLVFGLLVAVLLKTKSLGVGVGLAAFLFGFFTASTGAAKPIREVVAALAKALSDLG